MVTAWKAFRKYCHKKCDEFILILPREPSIPPAISLNKRIMFIHSYLFVSNMPCILRCLRKYRICTCLVCMFNTQAQEWLNWPDASVIFWCKIISQHVPRCWKCQPCLRLVTFIFLIADNCYLPPRRRPGTGDIGIPPPPSICLCVCLSVRHV